jgi:multiple antibiotic resistance protein
VRKVSTRYINAGAGANQRFSAPPIIQTVSELVFNAFVTLLVVLDPLGMAPIFVGLTRGRTDAYRREAAIRGTALGTAILFVFALVGQELLDALGIGFSAFRIAGGALLFLLSLDMVFARPLGMRRAVREGEEAQEEEDDISVFPLAIPLIAGPGALTTILLYTDNGDLLEVTAVMGVLLVVLLLVLFSLLLAPRVMSVFGQTGANVLSRVLGVLLAALAVQFVLDGITQSFAL